MKTNVFECHLNFDDLDIDMSEPTDTEPTYLVESPDRVAKIWCCLDRSVGFILPLLFYPLLSSRLNGLLQNTRSPPSSLWKKKKKNRVANNKCERSSSPRNSGSIASGFFSIISTCPYYPQDNMNEVERRQGGENYEMCT